ncbi:hypothetical protein C0J52_00034 [Blattella germanica]|nr:hypothetical protein C0J52_00034 [Blattella germanica]
MSGWVTLKENGKDDVDKLENAKSTKELLFKLKLLGGFYKDTLYKGRLRVTFKRNSNDDMAMHVWSGAKPGKIEIKSMYIRSEI